MNIRHATLADMPQMLVNSRKFIDTTAYKDFFEEESIREELLVMMEHGLCIVAEVDGHHLGGVGAVKQSMFINKGIFVAAERYWWVEPGERARGVGKGLLQAIMEAGKKAGCQQLMMLSLADPAVDKIYLSLGFTEAEHCFMRAL